MEIKAGTWEFLYRVTEVVGCLFIFSALVYALICTRIEEYSIARADDFIWFCFLYVVAVLLILIAT